jgi:hypothetical protein
MANKPRKRKPASRRATPPLTRAMLLPTHAATTRACSLANHLALAALRRGQGNLELVGRLLKTVYLTYLVGGAGQGWADVEPFLTAEVALTASMMRARSDDRWRVDEADCASLETILALHDTQLASVPVHVIETAKLRLTREVQDNRTPDMAVMSGSPQWRQRADNPA